MLTRIVKMTFHQEHVDDFIEIFNENKKAIRGFKGVQYLELLRDSHDPNVFFTHSIWDDAKNLEAYRNSPLFYQTWSKTKKLFSSAPEAWSLNSQLRLP